jgi:hypothetical protein
MESNFETVTGETRAEWNASHRESGYIPLNHIVAIRQNDGTWDIDLQPAGPKRIGFLCQDTQNPGQWCYQSITAIRLGEQHERDIKEVIQIISGKV